MNGLNIFHQFVSEHQLESIPRHLWKALHKKLTDEVFDAGEHFELLLIEYDEDAGETARPIFTLSAIHDIKAADPNAIYLIDHAWTFRTSTARQQLAEYTGLTERLCVILGIPLDDTNRIEKVMQNIWRHCQSYTIQRSDNLSDDDKTPIWYIMDEVGCAVNHSDDPNFRIVPFYYNNNQTTYSLLYPLRDVASGEQINRDFIECMKESPERSAMLLFWQYTDFTKESFLQVEPGAEYFLAGHVAETVPNIRSENEPHVAHGPLKVYADYDVVRQYLTDPLFELVESEDDADVLWLTYHFKNFAELANETPQKFVNQFPYEYVLTVKDLLSIVCRRAAKESHNLETLDTYPRWMPTTFNLKTELVKFASYYQHRQARADLDNFWIVKPWNLARGLDTHVTNNIAEIVRLSTTGPKIAQKYIVDPVLYHRVDVGGSVKFDIRYCLLVRSINPLRAYVHRKFFLRFANKPFSLDNLHDYEQHFTVMNYNENSNLYHLKCEDFLVEWNRQYPQHEWKTLEDEICFLLFELLECAKKSPPPMGIAHNSQSRAFYAVDMMLEWCSNRDGTKGMEPKLLEVNWTPDCKRACEYYPEFFNDTFKLLFLDDNSNDQFRLLSSRDAN